MLKEKLKEHSKKLQETVKELEGKNYYLKRKGRVLRKIIEDYQDQVKILENFTLMVFILGQLMIGLYLLGFFDDNNACITIF